MHGHVLCQQTNWFLIKLQKVKINQILFNITVGLSRLCSVTFQQPLALGATFCGSRTLEQVLPFLVTFEQNIGLGHTSTEHENVNDVIKNFKICEFLAECLSIER